MKRSATMAVLAAAGILVSATGAHATTTELEGTGEATMPRVQTATPRTACAGSAAAPDVTPAHTTVTPAAHGAAVFAALRGQGLSRGWAADGARLAAQGAAYEASRGPSVRDPAARDPLVDLAAYGSAVFTALVEQGVPRGMAASGARYAAQAAAFRAWQGVETVACGVTVAPVTVRPFDSHAGPGEAWYYLL